MTTKKKGFTLIEILSVIVILAVIFLFITPRMIKQINNGKDTETKLIEQRVLSAAKEYVNNHDADFYKKLVSVGDVNYIYKSDLINTGLITETDVEELTNFTAVKGKLLSDDKIEYTVEYINNPSNEYANQELYLMIQNLTNRLNSITASQEGEGYNILDAYPIGSIYISISSANPSTLFGGTWAPFGTGKTLVGVDTNDTDFSTSESTGGEKTHTLTIAEMPKHGHPVYIWDNAGTTGNAWYYNGNTQVTHSGARLYNSSASSWIASGSTAAAAGSGRGDPSGTTELVGSGSPHNNLQPYVTVYMFKRTA